MNENNISMEYAKQKMKRYEELRTEGQKLKSKFPYLPKDYDEESDEDLIDELEESFEKWILENIK